jgi:hypothetical protein
VPIAAVSERLGHANPGITLCIYAHAIPADHELAAAVWNHAMADVIRGPQTVKPRAQAHLHHQGSPGVTFPISVDFASRPRDFSYIGRKSGPRLVE